MKRSRIIQCVALALFIFAGLGGSAQADEARIIDEKKESDQLVELTVETSAFSEPTKVHVFLPVGYLTTPRKLWPVTYVLAGMQNNYNSFANFLNGEELVRDFPSIVVSPDGNSGFWSDWFNGGDGGPPRYETFVIDQLIELIDRKYNTLGDRAHRAIFGISMGGYGAAALAAKHPDLFGAVASISGATDSNNPLIGTTISLAPTFDGGAIDAIYGPRATEEVRWRGSNPVDLASNLRDLNVQVRTANGVLNPEIGEGDDPADALSCLVENGVYQGSTSFHQALDESGVEHLWKDYGNGCHTPENFTREVVDTLASLKEVLANPAPAPERFEYRTIDPGFDVWGWQVKADPDRALEFMEVESAGNTFSALGSGMTSVTTPPLYRGLRKVDVNGKAMKVAADGRVGFRLDLGAPHLVQQFRPGASNQFQRATVTFKPHAVIRITRAKRLRSGARVCVKAVGGVVPKAKIRLGKRQATMKVTGKTRCRNLKAPGRPRLVRVAGKDTYGHPVKSSRKVSRRG